MPLSFVAAYFIDDTMSSLQVDWLTTPLGALCAGQLILQTVAYILSRFELYGTFSFALTVNIGRKLSQE
ncbi:hypothetical protein [Saccharothrix sp. HUAS TT1]|uniref:hypothetical protein n=1 Tax=unclassified Saccharothrix TaxID=2593673 RepID=UPI00345B64E6